MRALSLAPCQPVILCVHLVCRENRALEYRALWGAGGGFEREV